MLKSTDDTSTKDWSIPPPYFVITAKNIWDEYVDSQYTLKKEYIEDLWIIYYGATTYYKTQTINTEYLRWLITGYTSTTRGGCLNAK